MRLLIAPNCAAIQAGRLRGREPEGLLHLRRIETQEAADGGRHGERSEYGSGVPAASEHLGAVEREADAGSYLEANHGRADEISAGRTAREPRCREERRDEERGAVERGEGMEVVELEALDERAVEERRRGRARGPTPTDEGTITPRLRR
jgi:hypothetical protein